MFVHKRPAITRLMLMSRFFVCLLAFVLVLIGARPLRAQNPPVPPFQNPPQNEQNVFNTILARLNGHTNLIPNTGKVNDIIMAFTSQVSQSINCPATDSTPARTVIVNMNAKLVKWNKAIVRARLIGGGAVVGAMFMDFSATGFNAQNVKTVTMTFRMMLDPTRTLADEADAPLGVLANETLLYHELLHGQLMMNAVMADAVWQGKACSGTIDGSPSDLTHVKIFPLQEQFISKLAGVTKTVSVQRLTANPGAGATGDFDIDLGKLGDLVPPDKTDFSGTKPRLIDKSNVFVDRDADPKQPRIEVVLEGPPTAQVPHVRLKGKLIDRTKKGFILVRIDPPTDFVFFGIEQAITIEPAMASIPTVSEWGLVVLALLLLVGAKTYYNVGGHKENRSTTNC